LTTIYGSNCACNLDLYLDLGLIQFHWYY